MNILNIAAYHFARLPEAVLPDLRAHLKVVATEENLKGTVLLSPEGINLFLAGTPESIRRWQAALVASDPSFAELTYKNSYSDDQPFNRLLVKIKKEIIPFEEKNCSPLYESAPNLSPAELKQWLDEKRPVTLLDVRNDYEIRIGTFKDAKNFNLQHFRDLPKHLPEHELPKDQPIVTFCTGGIRCEKAAPYLKEQGYDVYQLQGGILQYFEDCGGAHYEGECFVFDKRVALDPELKPTATAKCFVCWQPLTVEEQQLPEYIPDVACSYCNDTRPKSAENL